MTDESSPGADRTGADPGRIAGVGALPGYDGSVLDVLPEGIVVQLASGEIVAWNPAAERILGLTRDELAGRTSVDPRWRAIRENGAPFQGDSHPAMVTLRTGEALRDVIMGLHLPDGSLRWISISSYPIPGPDGRPRSVVTRFVDVTERRREEEESRVRDEMHRHLFERMAQGVIYLDSSFNLLEANPAAERILRFRGEELKAHSSFHPAVKLLRGDGSEMPREEHPLVLATHAGKPIDDFVIGVKYPDRDAPFWLSVTQRPIFRPGESAPSHICSIFTDITEKWQAERALRESEARYRLLAENMADVVWTLDPNAGRFTYVSPSVEQLRGYTPEEVMAEPVRVALADASAENVFQGFETVSEALAATRGRRSVRTDRIDQPRRDGSIVPTEVVTTLLHDDSGRIVEVLGVTRDITERVKAEEEMRKLNASLEKRVMERTSELTEANRELEAYSYSVAHELRTPLRAIDGFSARIASALGGQLDEEGRRLFAEVRWNAQRMGQLIDDLLLFSQVRRVGMTFSAVDMAGAARVSFSAIVPDAAAMSRISFSVGDLPASQGDARLLRRVWENLLSNAVKFSKDRELSEIRVEGSIEGSEAIYRVRDNGVGFDMKHVEKLFGVFNRLHGQRDFEGTGVGLALVRRIVARHGGRVWAESEPGRGATFSFALPVGKGSDTTAESR